VNALFFSLVEELQHLEQPLQTENYKTEDNPCFKINSWRN
jgi:hypothetical protein